MNTFALANAVNILVAESGSIMYNYYNAHKSLNHYVVFVLVYGISRLLFSLWSLSVLYQAWFPFEGAVYPFWAPYVITILQLTLLAVNFTFLMTHVRKLNRKLKDHRGVVSEESDGDHDMKAEELLRRRPVRSIEAAAANMGEA